MGVEEDRLMDSLENNALRGSFSVGTTVDVDRLHNAPFGYQIGDFVAGPDRPLLPSSGFSHHPTGGTETPVRIAEPVNVPSAITLRDVVLRDAVAAKDGMTRMLDACALSAERDAAVTQIAQLHVQDLRIHRAAVRACAKAGIDLTHIEMHAFELLSDGMVRIVCGAPTSPEEA